MVTSSHAAPARDTGPFLAAFEARPPSGPDWLVAFRRTALRRFAELGLPSAQLEDWRFTPLNALLRLPFRPQWKPAVTAPESGRLRGRSFGALPGPCLVFIDGHWHPELSNLSVLPPGVHLGNLHTGIEARGAWLERQLGRDAASVDNAFAALNRAFFTDGGLIHLEPGAVLEEPIQLVFATTSGESGAYVQPRNVIVAEAGSRVTVIEQYLSLTTAAHVTNTVTELVAGEGARVEHLKFQDEHPAAVHLGALQAELAGASQVWMHSLVLGARLARNHIRTRLAGPGLECILNGLYLTRGDQLADHHMVVEHLEPHCASHEYFNGILDDKSRGVFHGRILVRPQAQQTDAKQTNKNLLLSDEARVNTKPQLEIYADDVKCTHGATVGQLNPESIFYLRSRGLGLGTARRMLIHAFAGEILDRVQSEPVREILSQLVWDRLEQNPHIAGVP